MPAMTSYVVCARCGSPLPQEACNTGRLATCWVCGARMRVAAFPALVRPPQAATAGQRILHDGQAGCFYHPSRQAAAPCDNCGRFLCSLCDIEIGPQHLCAPCIEKGYENGQLPMQLSGRRLYDSVALGVALWPILLFPLTLLSAPLAIVLALVYWKKPLGLTRRGRGRLVMALALGAVQLAGWAIALTWYLRSGEAS